MGNTERSANRGARLLDIMLESVVVYDSVVRVQLPPFHKRLTNLNY